MGKKKMVGGVPMATIYQGMSTERLEALEDLRWQAWNNVRTDLRFVAAWDDPRVEAEFSRLLDRAATKAGWHANRKATQP